MQREGGEKGGGAVVSLELEALTDTADQGGKKVDLRKKTIQTYLTTQNSKSIHTSFERLLPINEMTNVVITRALTAKLYEF